MKRTVGQLVTQRREELGMNANEVASKAKVDPSTLRTLETDDRWPRASSRARIEQALDWPAGTLTRLRRGDEVPEVNEFDLSQPTPVDVHATAAWVIISRDYPQSLMTLSRREAEGLHDKLGKVLGR